MRKLHKQIDVAIFNELTKKEYYEDQKPNTQKALLKKIEKIHYPKINLNEFNIDRQKEIENIKAEEFGFRDRKDFNFEFTQNILSNSAQLRLIPLTIYEMVDKADMPELENTKTIGYCMLVADAVERIKLRAENTLKVVSKNKDIRLYARKNIRIAYKIFAESKKFLELSQKRKNHGDIQIAFIQNRFIIHLICFLQDLFGDFCSSIKSEEELRNSLYELIDLRTCMEMSEKKGNPSSGLKIEKGALLRWNGQVNTLVTLFYDLSNNQITNSKSLLEANVEDIKFLLTNFFTDKKGDFIKDSTIDTYMKEYRDDKRAKGKKRIEILN